MARNKHFLSVITIMLLSGLALAQKNKSKHLKPDYVPNAETAIKIAEAIWLPIYGNEIYESKPFIAKLKDSTLWIVEGTLNSNYQVGGTPYIEIRKKDCKILVVTHDK